MVYSHNKFLRGHENFSVYKPCYVDDASVIRFRPTDPVFEKRSQELIEGYVDQNIYFF